MEGKSRKDFISAIHETQQESGMNYISPEKLMDLSREFDVPIVEASGLVSFYHMFSTEPRGKYIFRVCDSLACRICGSVDIFLYLSEKLGIDNHETTPNNLFTLEVVPCIGACDSAPNVMVNNTLHRNITPDKIDEIIDSILKEEGNED